MNISSYQHKYDKNVWAEELEKDTCTGSYYPLI